MICSSILRCGGWSSSATVLKKRNKSQRVEYGRWPPGARITGGPYYCGSIRGTFATLWISAVLLSGCSVAGARVTAASFAVSTTKPHRLVRYPTKATSTVVHFMGSRTTTATGSIQISDDNNISNGSPNSNIIDGKQIAADIRAEIGAQIRANPHLTPGLAVILVGSRRDSQTYVNMKKKACAEVGIVSQGYDFNEHVTQSELLETVSQLNADPAVHGILIQLPLPSHLNADAILAHVDSRKDVDGLHPANVAALQLYNGDYRHAPFHIPCTPLGCLELLDRSGVDLKGKACAVLGRSRLVGLPMARLLLGRDATVTVCHSATPHPATVLARADVVIAAVGRPHLVQPDWIREGAVVIDVGINSVPVDDNPKKPYKLVGDVDFEAVQSKCSKITPVPGGVGPMTIAMLLQNTLRSCERYTAAAANE